jgi:hypothetical protein
VRFTTVGRKEKPHRRAVCVSIVLVAIGGLSGILFQKYYSVGRLLQGLDWRDSPVSAVSVPMPRTEMPLNSLHGKRVMVALVFGQSNAANFGESPLQAREGVYNFYQGKLYAAYDPLLGADGDGGSVWTRLGNKLITSQDYEAVVFIAVGVGGTTIARWKPDGDVHPRLREAIRDVQAHQLAITHVLWHQGESDALLKTSRSAYRAMFLEILASLRQHGVHAPMYIAVATRCQKQRADHEIRQAQQSLVHPGLGIYAGPDTDQLGFGDRYDGCHFSDEGLEKGAELWFAKLRGH